MRVNRASDNFTIVFSKFWSFVVEGGDFCWANESEIEWVEKEANVFSFVIAEADFFEFAVDECLGLKSWSWFSNQARYSASKGSGEHDGWLVWSEIQVVCVSFFRFHFFFIQVHAILVHLLFCFIHGLGRHLALLRSITHLHILWQRHTLPLFPLFSLYFLLFPVFFYFFTRRAWSWSWT